MISIFFNGLFNNYFTIYYDHEIWKAFKWESIFFNYIFGQEKCIETFLWQVCELFLI